MILGSIISEFQIREKAVFLSGSDSSVPYLFPGTGLYEIFGKEEA